MFLFGSSFLTVSAVGGQIGNLRNINNHADYIVIAPESYYSLAETLAEFRHDKNNFTTMVVNLDTILVQFGTSVSKDTALKNFIQYTLKNWTNPKPQYFVLAGNTNAIPSHPEPETLINAGIAQYDTTLMIDRWFVEDYDSKGNLQVNACLGRLPAWDSSGLSVMISKTINYEQELPGVWCNRAICLSDYNLQDGGNIFESDENLIKTSLGTIWNDTITVHVRSDSQFHLSTTGFLDLWNSGAAIVSYSGHANQETLSATHYFVTESVDSLTNGYRLPVCFLGGCDLTYDTRPPLSIPTHLLEKVGGGAVAVISSEGLNFESNTFSFYTSLINTIIQKPDNPIGICFKEASSDYGNDISERFTFLGDPALTVKHPSISTIVQHLITHSETFMLMQNFPNPFNPTTLITYQLPIVSNVTLKVYDMVGKEVKTLVNSRQSAGLHSVIFNASNLSSGVYFYRMIAGDFVQTKKLILLK
jgi:Peptidase family C25/Secretion system C-terminal sorting domain